jgi:hypothetical protein
MTRAEIERYLGVCEKTAFRRIQRLRDRLLLRIVGYQRTEGKPAPVYGVADGKPDVPEPAPMTTQERNTNYRRRHQVRISVRRYGERSTLVGPWAGLLRRESCPA